MKCMSHNGRASKLSSICYTEQSSTRFKKFMARVSRTSGSWLGLPLHRYLVNAMEVEFILWLIVVMIIAIMIAVQLIL